MCALGKTAPNPVLSTLNHFRDEYEAHINQHRCPSLSCKELIAFHIDPEKCKGLRGLLPEMSGRSDRRR